MNGYNDLFDWAFGILPTGSINTKLPYKNVKYKENGDAVLEFQFAGVSKDRIKVGLEDGNLTIRVAKNENPDKTTYRYSVHELKKFDGSFDISYKVDPEEYDVKSTDVVFKDGILTINIIKKQPKKEKAVMFDIK